MIDATMKDAQTVVLTALSVIMTLMNKPTPYNNMS